MPSVYYDVAVSADGFIAGPDADVSKFAQTGAVVDAYRTRLATYRTAIMGRASYDVGVRFGLTPGDNPYPHMRTVVFSETMSLPHPGAVEIARSDLTARVRAMDGPVYLCGGGVFAAAMLDAGLVTHLRLKRAPVFLGRGTPLFADGRAPMQVTLTDSQTYENGYLYQEFRL